MKWITEKGWRCHLFLAFFLLTGCGSQLSNYRPWQHPNGGSELHVRLDEGNRLFMAGDYPAAESVFQHLQETGDPDVVRPALYGLACSRFMLADSRQDYLDAIETFELWQRISPETPKREDPRMLLALFSGPVSRGGEDVGDVPADSEEKSLMWIFSSQERIGELEGQITRLQKEVVEYEAQKDSVKEMAAANRVLEEKLKAKEETTRAMAEELSKLREQMRNLETIDQEIQEKKQGIASP